MKPAVSIAPERPKTENDPQRTFSKKQRAEIFRNANGACSLCGTQIRGKWVAGHIVPWALGGPTTAANGRVECLSCAPTTQKTDAGSAAKTKAMAGLTGQRARREKHGPMLRSRNTLGGEEYQSRKAFAERMRRETE